MPWVVAFLFVALHQYYLARAQPDAPYMDTLRLLHQMEEWRAGRLSLLELWGPQSGHRGLVNQLMLLVNVEFFGLDIALANRVTGFVMFVIAGLVSGAFWQSLRTGQRASNIASGLGVLFIPLIFFGWAGFELLTLDLGLPLFLKILCVVAYFMLHANLMARLNSGSHHGFASVSGLALFGLAIVLAISMGWSYAFVGAVLLTQVLVLAATRGRTGWRAHAWLPSAALVAGLALYVLGGRGEGGLVSGGNVFEELTRVVRQAFYALGSTWLSLESANFYHISLDWLAIAGATSAVGSLWAVIARLRRGLFQGSLLPFYLILYGGLTAVSVCIARGGISTEAVMASRYYSDLSLFLVGTIWLCLEEATVRWQAGRRLPLQAVLPILALVGVAQFVTYQREWQVAPYRAVAFAAMQQALLAGVPNEAAASLLQSPLEHARLGVAVMRQRHLGVFRHTTPSTPCDTNQIGQASGWHGAESGGAWMSGEALLSVPDCNCSLKAQVYLPDTFVTRTLTVTDPAAQQPAILKLRPGQVETIRLQASRQPRLVQLSTSEVTVPFRDLRGQDQRSLGVFWSGLSFECVVGSAAR